MKKILMLLVTALLFGMLAVPAAAADEALSVSDMNAQPGDMVYLRVTLNQSVTGDSMAVSYSFDKELLKAEPKSCTWEKKGIIQEFNNKKMGAWAAESPMGLKGDLCVLALQVREGVTFAETKVSCTVTIKNGGKVAGEYTAEGTVSMACDHQYGGWTDGGSVGHVQECSLCGRKITASHGWDDGKTEENPDDENTNLITYTCTVCGGVKQEKVAAEREESAPTAPTRPTEEQTEPTWVFDEHGGSTGIPQEHPEETHPDPTRPKETIPGNNSQPGPEENPGQTEKPDGDNGSQSSQKPSGGQADEHNGNEEGELTRPTNYVDYNAPADGTEPGGEVIPGHEGHDHSGIRQESVPMNVEGNGIIETVVEDDHVHEEDEGSGGPGAVAAVAVLLALIVGLPVYIRRSKKKI